ncbi:MAG: N-(5'-phosphoribosyl)anthranilate isomerase [Bryobacteraceae bacterium]|nr:MAG: N-(5'-phosphoribosyl)anthranilate isomerase [Bryobacteraceae bacterium]
MTLIKICGITALEDALAACDAGADALGFNFWPRSPRYIRPERAAQIIERLPGNVLAVGVFVDSAAEDIEAIAAAAGVEIAQLHGQCGVPRLRWWKALEAGPELRREMEQFEAEAFLVDAPAGAQRGGTGRTFDWQLVRGLPARIVLAGGLGPDNVREAIAAVRPWGVDACSRLESAPGRKDAVRVREFIRAVRESE